MGLLDKAKEADVNAHCLSSESVTIVASYSNCPLFYEACEQPRPAIPGPRALSKPDIPTNRTALILPDRCARVNTCSIRCS